MVDIKLIIIGVLVILSLWQYASPDKSQEFLEPYLSGIVDFVDIKNPFNSNSTNETTEDKCSTHAIDKVCGINGVTYDNQCYGILDDIWEFTPGEC